MGYEDFLDDKSPEPTEEDESRDGGVKLTGGVSSTHTGSPSIDDGIDGDESRLCPECVEWSDWNGKVYKCSNPECPNDSFILGFKERPYFGCPLKTLPPSRESEGKRNEHYGEVKSDIKAINQSADEEEEKEEPEESGGTLEEWL